METSTMNTMRRNNTGGLLASYSLWWSTTGRSHKTIENYLYTLTRLADRIDAGLLHATPADLQRFIAERLATVAPATAANDFRALRSFYAWATDEGDITTNPALDLRTPKVVDTPVTVATETDYKRLIATCPKAEWAGRRDAAIIACLWWGGFRRGELAVLDVAHVDLDTAYVTVPKTKSGKPRRVPMHPDLIAICDRWLRRRGYDPGPLFLSERGTRLTSNGIGQMIERRAATAGVNVSAHSFRRALATRWLRAGGTEVGLRAAAGWRSPAMVARYTRMNAEELAHAEYHRLFG